MVIIMKYVATLKDSEANFLDFKNGTRIYEINGEDFLFTSKKLDKGDCFPSIEFELIFFIREKIVYKFKGEDIKRI